MIKGLDLKQDGLSRLGAFVRGRSEHHGDGRASVGILFDPDAVVGHIFAVIFPTSRRLSYLQSEYTYEFHERQVSYEL